MGAYGRVREHQIFHGGGGIDADTADLLGDLTIGVGDRGASGKCLRLCAARSGRGDAESCGADVAAVPAGRCLRHAMRTDHKCEHEDGESDGF